jgi:hypothetical protein
MNKILSIIMIILINTFICGCIDKPITFVNNTVPIIVPIVNITPTTTQTITSDINNDPIVETEYTSFQNFLFIDNISEKIYDNNQAVPYPDRYICSHFARDFKESATNAGYKVYIAWLTGIADYDINYWHMTNVVKLDGKWYFIEPQTDEIITINNAYDYYHYEYAHIGKSISIQRNDGVLSDRIRDESGLINGEFIYLK